jgi:hypothetical protein
MKIKDKSKKKNVTVSDTKPNMVYEHGTRTLALIVNYSDVTVNICGVGKKVFFDLNTQELVALFNGYELIEHEAEVTLL